MPINSKMLVSRKTHDVLLLFSPSFHKKLNFHVVQCDVIGPTFEFLQRGSRKHSNFLFFSLIRGDEPAVPGRRGVY